MKDQDDREKAVKTVIDGFTVVERIYRHSFQVLMSLKEELKTEHEFKESPSYSSFSSANEPKSWIWQFRGLYLAPQKILLEGYQKNQVPILFLQVSMYSPNGREPILRYGVISRISNIATWKGARFDDYFKKTLTQMHDEQKTGNLKTTHCEAKVEFEEKALLDIREDKDILHLAKEISEKYIKYFHN
jgi:hypothetical protein